MRLLFCVCLAGAIAIASFGRTKKLSTEQLVIRQYQQDLTLLTREVTLLTQLAETGAGTKQVQLQFKKTRTAYKKIEWMAEYFNAYTTKFINGPAIPEVDPEQKTTIIEPEGFQVVEEYLFPTYDRSGKAAIIQQCKILKSNIGRLRNNSDYLQTSGAYLFDALRLEVFRIIALGISGFDSPVARHSLPEAAASLQALEQAYSFYREEVKKADPELDQKLEATFRQAQAYLQQHRDFNSFDRMQLITQCLNPLSEHLLAAQQQLNFPVFKEPRAIRAGAKTLFAKGIFNANYYLPNISEVTTADKIALGRALFYDNSLSADGKRSCVTCHQPQKAFTDGLPTSMSVHGKPLQRNALSLVNAGLQPSLFWDNRVAFLEDQIREVVENKEEMGGSLEKAVRQLNQREEYRKLFQKAYGDTATEDAISNAIASYIRSLTSLDAPFDQYMRGDFSAMTPTEIEGFNLFMGKAKCATCHFVPLFNGSVPPQCDKIDAEIIGVPATADTVKPRLDKDPGKYNVFKIELHRHAFKTPTLRNIALTAPYMHNGVFRTLEEVVEFYNRGGGAGMGMKIENQTLPEDRLHLTAPEKGALVAFLKTLTDTSYSR
ncbi:cytochrome c peroxidase [Paraflavisolibacter sp. H34]